jgi:predicted PurR-regulated permease PerM
VAGVLGLVIAVPIASVIKRMADVMRTPSAALSPLHTTVTAAID